MAGSLLYSTAKLLLRPQGQPRLSNTHTTGVIRHETWQTDSGGLTVWKLTNYYPSLEAMGLSEKPRMG